MEDPQDLIKAAAKVADDVKIAAKVVSDAVSTAEIIRKKAALDAAQLLLNAKEENTKTLANALRETFGEHENSQRFIDTARIPLICKDISNMNVRLEKIDGNLTWIVRLVIGGIVMALLGVVLIK